MRRKSWGSAFVRYEISCESIEKVNDPVRSPEDPKSGKNCRPASLCRWRQGLNGGSSARGVKTNGRCRRPCSWLSLQHSGRHYDCNYHVQRMERSLEV
jgi:hypothetical protein